MTAYGLFAQYIGLSTVDESMYGEIPFSCLTSLILLEITSSMG